MFYDDLLRLNKMITTNMTKREREMVLTVGRHEERDTLALGICLFSHVDPRQVQYIHDVNVGTTFKGRRG